MSHTLYFVVLELKHHVRFLLVVMKRAHTETGHNTNTNMPTPIII
jgi:hypothetical protein